MYRGAFSDARSNIAGYNAAWSGCPEELSAEELSAWVLTHEGTDPDWSDVDPSVDTTLPGRCVRHLGGWLDSGRDLGAIERREMLDGLGIVLSNALSRDECRRIIATTEEVGYGPIGEAQRGAISILRNNLWLQIDDAGSALGEEIWRRVRPHLPVLEELEGEGVWVPVGINSNYRFAKYYPVGSVFAKHIDRPTVHGHEQCSIYTVCAA